ncbi:hypothetical protein GJ744_005704 [Endocarpon pusillum]|uniref:Uncharacterized protein n=1 Tax=Endocarpon pusillum TaxID=364733 RepID=A0A8H7ANZ3_9EURO|nr:hypothetical protein GJ744_005704 [Endocarpon pusillum]
MLMLCNSSSAHPSPALVSPSCYPHRALAHPHRRRRRRHQHQKKHQKKKKKHQKKKKKKKKKATDGIQSYGSLNQPTNPPTNQRTS